MNRNCAHVVTVKAVEHVLPNLTAAKVAGKFKLCSYPEDDFAGVIQVAKRNDIEPESLEAAANVTIVAKCGTQERLYELPDPDLLKFEALKRADLRIAALWDLKDDVEERAFGKDFAFSKATIQQSKEQQELGAKIVPEILAGKFDSGFADTTCPFAECRDHNAKSALQGYAGSIEDRDPAFVQLLNPASLHLLNFDLPPYPREAQRAGAQGEVRLKIFFDPSTGAVTNAEPLSGDDQLQDAAVNAVRAWHFETGVGLKSPVEATLRFGFHCPTK
jgi:TonB family protein